MKKKHGQDSDPLGETEVPDIFTVDLSISYLVPILVDGQIFSPHPATTFQFSIWISLVGFVSVFKELGCTLYTITWCHKTEWCVLIDAHACKLYSLLYLSNE